MKLNLLYNGTDVRAGYSNVDPFGHLPNSQEWSEKKIVGDFKNLDWICDDGEAEDIIVNNVLRYVTFDKVSTIINHYISKLKNGGTITIIDKDVREINKLIFLNNINMEQANEALYGSPKNTWDIQRSSIHMDFVNSLFSQLGLNIIKRRVHNCNLCITGVKP